MPPVFRGASYIYRVLAVCYRVDSAGQHRHSQQGHSYFLGRGNCNLQTGVVWSLWLVPSSDSDKRKLIGIWRVSGPGTLLWEILIIPLRKNILLFSRKKTIFCFYWFAMTQFYRTLHSADMKRRYWIVRANLFIWWSAIHRCIRFRGETVQQMGLLPADHTSSTPVQILRSGLRRSYINYRLRKDAVTNLTRVIYAYLFVCQLKQFI